MKCNATLLSLLFVIASGFFITSSKAQNINVNDSLALVDLYNSTNGPSWNYHTNWLTTKPVSSWYGVTVTGSRVTALSLSFNNLNGILPGSAGNLAQLTSLDLSFNSLTGSLPAGIGNLTKLTYLNLGINQLSDTITATIGNLMQLTFLDMDDNQLSGTIPASIGNMTNLTNFYLNGNQLTGSIPSTIGKLANLTILDLDGNQLSGSIPASINRLTNLTYLVLHNNRLSGSIPADIGKLTNLTDLNLSSNQLSGTIPWSLGKLANLQYLMLHNNLLSGAIPASLNKLKHLFTINLSYNLLSQYGDVYNTTDTNYATGNIDFNLFTFDGMEFIVRDYPRTTYEPQNILLPAHQNGNMLSVYAGGTLSNNTYTWHRVGATSKIIIAADSTFKPVQNGKYYVTVTNKIAVKLTLKSDTINFIAMPGKQSNNLLVANKAAMVIKHMQVYPNPASDIIYIQTNSIAAITLITGDGKVMLTQTINNKGSINVSAFAIGVYYIQNKTTGEKQKIVVVH